MDINRLNLSRRLSHCHWHSTVETATVRPVLMLHEQAAPAVTSVPTTFITRHFPTSVLLHEQRDEFKPLLHIFKEEKTSQATIDRMQIENTTADEDFNIDNFYRLVKDFQQLHISPLQTCENQSTTSSKSNTTANEHMDLEPCDVLTLAKYALSASIEAASLAESSNLIGAGFNESISMGILGKKS